ncbi:MAG: gliding motility-associated C-terminal domain-containing protein, partial [Bacteroidales bacterium]
NVTVSPTATTTYSVTGTTPEGCTGTAEVTVTVHPLPNITATASPTAICSGASSELTASGASTYSWSGGLGTGASKTVTPSATTTYTVTGTSTAGCTGTATVTVTVNPLPTVTATASPTAICNGETSLLTASGTDNYIWSTGGNTASITVTPSATTTYIVTGTSTEGCTGTAAVTVTVNPLPTVTATASPTAICNGETSLLTASGTDNYSWSTGGNTANITVTPSSTTTYTVTGTSAAGCTGTATVTLTVNPLPTVTASASPSEICEGESSTLTASSNITGTTFEWSGTLGTGSTKTVTPISTTTYSVTGTTPFGCSNSASITITVNALPNTNIVTSNDTICSGQSTILTANGADFYSWSHNLGTGLSKTVSPTSTTTYTVTGSFANGCSSTASIQITVNPIPDIVINASNNPICLGDSSILTIYGDAEHYLWSHNLGSGNTVTVFPVNNTTYTVTGTNSYGCTNSATIYITVNPIANATIIPVSPLCDNQGLITLTAQTSGGFWSGTGITNVVLGTFSPAIAGAGTHTITYMITGMCGDTATTEITVYESPNATAYATDETCKNGNDGTAWVEVTGGEPPYTYLWSTYHILDSLTNLAPGEYYVTVTDYHNCSDKDTVLIKPGTEDCYITHIYIPNIFAPDGRGNPENEYLRVYGKGIETIDFTIFDRWGNEVFHTTDINIGWDGTYKGEPALVGDYTYVIKVSYLNGNNESLKGHIYLIR